mmetsp:Transcript_26616/g.76178  ORF Transcript_26616/g.76178 Transcript_26616/m.76178 type:complete len:293 (-) Transcript_26616:17-895(-)
MERGNATHKFNDTKSSVLLSPASFLRDDNCTCPICHVRFGQGHDLAPHAIKPLEKKLGSRILGPLLQHGNCQRPGLAEAGPLVGRECRFVGPLMLDALDHEVVRLVVTTWEPRGCRRDRCAVPRPAPEVSATAVHAEVRRNCQRTCGTGCSRSAYTADAGHHLVDPSRLALSLDLHQRQLPGHEIEPCVLLRRELSGVFGLPRGVPRSKLQLGSRVRLSFLHLVLLQRIICGSRANHIDSIMLAKALQTACQVHRIPQATELHLFGAADGPAEDASCVQAATDGQPREVPAL